MSLREVKALVAKLAIEDLRKLDQWLHSTMERREREESAEKKSGREVVEVVEKGGWTYQLEVVRCGKEGCRCGKGEGHGPYWYGYRKEGNRTVSKYIGKKLSKADEG